ncbi:MULTISPECIES: hypothetical protein [unclassified Nocardioides]
MERAAIAAYVVVGVVLLVRRHHIEPPDVGTTTSTLPDPAV